mgnify:CR=1 FL=1
MLVLFTCQTSTNNLKQICYNKNRKKFGHEKRGSLCTSLLLIS